MRAMGDDFPHFVLGESGDVDLREFLEKKLVAETTGRITGASFFLTENRKIHTRCFQQANHGASHSLSTTVISSRTSDPIEQFEVRVLVNCRCAEAFGRC